MSDINSTFLFFLSSYIDKFSEFLRLFVSVHLRRFENNSQFPVLEFLSLLFRYTFHQHSVEAYFNCLDVWGIFLDHLSSKIIGAEDRNAVSRYGILGATVRKELLK